MSTSTFKENSVTEGAHHRFSAILSQLGIYLELHDDFERYIGIRRRYGDRHLNQAFDPDHAEFGTEDFWILAENYKREPVATYCLRRFKVNDFFDLIRSLSLWFREPSDYQDPRFVVRCKIPPFGGDVVHGGGLWVRDDYRGASRLALIMPRLARIFAWRQRPFDHDSAMIRNNPDEPREATKRKAIFMATKVYGFARAHPCADGWFPPEGRNALIHLCHATRAEAIASLLSAQTGSQASRYHGKFGKLPFVDQHYQTVYAAPVLSEWQQQPSIGVG
jgi:hypothetical protein